MKFEEGLDLEIEVIEGGLKQDSFKKLKLNTFGHFVTSTRSKTVDFRTFLSLDMETIGMCY